MFHAQLPLAFGFAQAAMLGWLVAAALPLVIHLLNRRKHREVEWAAMEWLLAALRKNAKRVRIEQWILLALRTLLIVCVVLAFAEPFLERMGLQFVAGERKHRLFVLDGSFSMDAVSNEKSHFERARELVTQIVEQSPEGDAFTLVLMSDPPRAIVATPAFVATDFLEELSNARLPHAGLDLPATLTRVEEILKRARNDHPRLARQEVIFVTDLQRQGWAPELNSIQAAEFRRTAERISRLARLQIVDVSPQPADNLAIAELRLAESLATIGRDQTAEVTIRNLGDRSANPKVELWVDGRQVGSQQLDAPAGASATALFQYRFDAPGEHACEARIAGDALDIDNHRWLALPVRDAIRVLCVNGKPSGEFGHATDYLTVALSPSDDATTAIVRPEVIRESALLETDLADYDCVFFCNVGQFTAAEAKLLDQFVQRGGGVVFFLGDQVQPESYNRFLGGEEPGTKRLLPARLGDARAEADYRLDPLGYQHPLLSIFRDQEQAGLISAPIRRYFQLTPAADSQAQVAAGLSSGDPIIIEEPIGLGHVVLVATSADASWNMLPVLPSYVPLVHELLNLAVRGRDSGRNLEVGQALTGDALGSAPTTVETPSGEREAVRVSGGAAGWQFADTLQSGLYRAQFESSDAPQLFAVNVDTRESQLAKLSPQELRSEVWPGVAVDIGGNWQGGDDDAALESTGAGKLNLFFLYAALGLLLLEPLAAWRFGQHRS